jgi:hypothetical protein
MIPGDLIGTMRPTSTTACSLPMKKAPPAVKEVILSRGLFCSFYSDRGSHYWHTPEAGGKVDEKPDPVRPSHASIH